MSIIVFYFLQGELGESLELPNALAVSFIMVFLGPYFTVVAFVAGFIIERKGHFWRVS